MGPVNTPRSVDQSSDPSWLLHCLEEGPGYAHLRLGATAPQARQAFRRLMAALGQNVSRDPRGHPIEEAVVRNAPDPSFAGQYRGTAHGMGGLPLHTDGSGEEDRVVRIVGMLCERQAPSGGVSTLADSMPVLEQLTAAELQLLQQDWPRRHPYRQDSPLTHKPILSWRREGRPAFDYGSARLRWGLESLPDGPDRQARTALLARVDRELERRSVSLRLLPGEALIVHNQRWLHGRTAFEDDPLQPRCIRRIWVGEYR